MRNKIMIWKHSSWQLAIIATFGIFPCTVISAQATPRSVDLFSINSGISNHNSSKNQSPVTVNGWFAKYDELREKYQPTDGDTVILTRPLMQQAERVQQWTNTANRISKNYFLLAKAIRNLPSPTGMPDVKEYRDLMADWYQDVAGVYLDLIRPRPAARTIEDLEEQLDAVKKRSDSLAGNLTRLKAMDRTLRQQHEVAISTQDDIIQQFVKSK